MSNRFYEFEEEEELLTEEESQLEEREYERELSRKRREGLAKEKAKRERKLQGDGGKPTSKKIKSNNKTKHKKRISSYDDYEY